MKSRSLDLTEVRNTVEVTNKSHYLLLICHWKPKKKKTGQQAQDWQQDTLSI
jgi:hypothetical protein